MPFSSTTFSRFQSIARIFSLYYLYRLMNRVQPASWQGGRGNSKRVVCSLYH